MNASALILVNNANSYGKSDSYRLGRWIARGELWKFSGLKRVQKCGRVSVTHSGAVGVRKQGEQVGFAGLATCGSVWACPVCNSKIQAFRRLEVGIALAVGSTHGSIAFGGWTLRHNRDQDLSELWPLLSKCWNRVHQDKTVQKLRKELGRYGYIRSTEITYGKNGWHPHIHPLVFFDREVSQKQLDDLFREEFRAWSVAAVSMGLDSPLEFASSFKLVTDIGTALSDYFAKVTFEMTSTQTKTSKGGRTPWQILNSFLATGDVDDLDLWLEYEAVSKGKRALLWSRGLKQDFQVQDQSDEELAETETGTVEDTGFYISDWTPIKNNPALGAQLLNVVAKDGFLAGRKFCEINNIQFFMP